MRNKILLPIASAILASALVFTVPAQAEESMAATTASEVYQEEVTAGLEDSIIGEVYEDQAGVENGEATEEDVVTPDSFLYSFKVFFEEVKLFFTFDDEKKAELLAQLASERLLEADFVAEKGDLELVKELIKAYEEKVAALEELTKENESVTEDTYDSVIDETYDADSVIEETYEEDIDGSENESEDTVDSVVYKYKLKNIAALTKVCNKVPDHVKPIILRNIQKAIEKRDAHIAKKIQKQYKKTAKTVTVEVTTSVEITDTNDQAAVAVTENIVTPAKVEKITKADKVTKGEKASKKEKHLKKKAYKQSTEISNDDQDKTKDKEDRENNSKGKGHNNKNRNDK